MNKSDYDKYYKKGGTYVIPVEVFNELFDELERLSFNYEQALEDLDKKDNIINEIENYFNKTKDTSTLEERMIANYMLRYIKKLKGSDKE